MSVRFPFTFKSLSILAFAERASEALHALRKDHSRRWSIYALSVTLHVIGVLFYYSVGEGLGLALDPWHYVVLVPVTVLVSALPITFNGLGLREGTLLVLADTLGAPLSPAASVTLGLSVYVIGLFVSLSGGVLYALEPRLRLQNQAETT